MGNVIKDPFDEYNTLSEQFFERMHAKEDQKAQIRERSRKLRLCLQGVMLFLLLVLVVGLLLIIGSKYF